MDGVHILEKIWKTAKSKTNEDGEEIIKKYLPIGFSDESSGSRISTSDISKENIVLFAMLDTKNGNFEDIKCKIETAWPLSKSLFSKRYFLVHI